MRPLTDYRLRLRLRLPPINSIQGTSDIRALLLGYIPTRHVQRRRVEREISFGPATLRPALGERVAPRHAAGKLQAEGPDP